MTVKEAGNAYLNWQYQKLETGEIGSRWFEDCREIIRDFVKAMTASRPTTDLRPEDLVVATRVAARAWRAELVGA